MMKRVLILFLGMFLFLPVFGNKTSDPKGNEVKMNRHNRDRRKHRMREIFDRLDLTKEQEASMHEIELLYKKRLEGELIKIEKNKLDMKEEWLKDTPDFEKLKSILEEGKKIEMLIGTLLLERDFKMKEILTTEQWMLFKNHIPKSPSPPFLFPMEDGRKGGRDPEKYGMTGHRGHKNNWSSK